jgi:hypothetical protein
MHARTRIACALALGAALPLGALADTLVTSDGAVVITPRVVQVQPTPRVVQVQPTPRVVQVQPQAPPTRVAPVAPAYPSSPYPAYPGRVTTVDGALIVPAAPLSHDDYLREMARRWDASDIAGMNLTPRQMSALTGHVDSNALAPLSGSGVSPGNMGPGNSRGQ